MGIRHHAAFLDPALRTVEREFDCIKWSFFVDNMTTTVPANDRFGPSGRYTGSYVLHCKPSTDLLVFANRICLS